MPISFSKQYQHKQQQQQQPQLLHPIRNKKLFKNVRFFWIARRMWIVVVILVVVLVFNWIFIIWNIDSFLSLTTTTTTTTTTMATTTTNKNHIFIATTATTNTTTNTNNNTNIISSTIRQRLTESWMQLMTTTMTNNSSSTSKNNKNDNNNNNYNKNCYNGCLLKIPYFITIDIPFFLLDWNDHDYDQFRSTATTTTSENPQQQHQQITIATHCGANRFDRIMTQAKFWGGPISVAIYISSIQDIDLFVEQYQNATKKIYNVITTNNNNTNSNSSTSMIRTVTITIHIVMEYFQQQSSSSSSLTNKIMNMNMNNMNMNNMDQYLYPHNILRNMALENIHNTDYVLLLDGDFVTNYNAHDIIYQMIQTKSNGMYDKLRYENYVFALPPFDIVPFLNVNNNNYNKDSVSSSSLSSLYATEDMLPYTKQELLKMIQQRKRRNDNDHDNNINDNNNNQSSLSLLLLVPSSDSQNTTTTTTTTTNTTTIQKQLLAYAVPFYQSTNRGSHKFHHYEQWYNSSSSSSITTTSTTINSSNNNNIDRNSNGDSDSDSDSNGDNNNNNNNNANSRAIHNHDGGDDYNDKNEYPKDYYFEVSYPSGAEPYVLAYRGGQSESESKSKLVLPKYHEAFRGHGYNKVSWFWTLSTIYNYRFAILNDCFVSHLHHPIVPSNEQELGSKRNKPIYVEYQQEMKRHKKEKEKNNNNNKLKFVFKQTNNEES